MFQSNPASLAASRAMLYHSTSTQSNLSAAAAATALRLASIQSESQQDLNYRRPSSSSAVGAGRASHQVSSHPGLHRRTSSMSERSFRAQPPEDHARERREGSDSLMNASSNKRAEKSVKRRGSFSLSLNLRPNSQQKKDKHIDPGVIQPLPQQTPQPQSQSLIPAEQEQQQQQQQRKRPNKLQLSPKTDRDRDRPMSPSHSAMRLPHNPAIGSSASSIRSFQTDLSSIAEDHALDYPHGHPANHKLPTHLFPMKSALKGGSGPPSIISEAVSEESRSSVGAHDSRKAKARVSFSDEQESNHVVNSDGDNSPTKDGFLHSLNASGRSIATRTISPPVSPPISPETSPRVPTITPMVQTIQPIPTPPPKSPVENLAVPLNMNKGDTKGAVIKEKAPEIPKIITNEISNVPQVTIHVSPTPSVPPKPRLPGSFPDPSPDPTPPTSIDSDADDAREMAGNLYSHPQGRQLKPTNENNILDLERGPPLRTMELVSTKPGAAVLPGGENMIRLISDESRVSGVSLPSDALDRQKEATMRVEQARINGSKPKPRATVIAATSSTAATSPVVSTSPQLSSPKPATTKLVTKPAKLKSKAASKAQGTTSSSRTPMKPTLRENGTTNLAPFRSSIPKVSSDSPVAGARKPMRMSLRQDDYSTNAASVNMARGLMSLPRLERVPSDSSFKRLKRRDSSVLRTPVRSLRVDPIPEPRTTLRKRRNSDSSSDIVSGGRTRTGLIFDRFRASAVLDQSKGVTMGSRFQDSSDDDDGLPTHFRMGNMHADSEPSSPIARRRSSFTQLFRRRPVSSGLDEDPPAVVVPMTPITDGDAANVQKGGRRLLKSGRVYEKEPENVKRFQGLRRLFRIKE